MTHAFSRSPWALLVLAMALAGAVRAADAPAEITVEGQVAHTLHLSRDDIQHFPATTIDVTLESHHGTQTGKFTGAALIDLLNKAEITDGPAKGARLNHAIVVIGSDGYAVVIAPGEIDPEFEGKKVIVAYTVDGAPVPGTGLRLVVPGDHRGGRSVHDVVKIEVK